MKKSIKWLIAIALLLAVVATNIPMAQADADIPTFNRRTRISSDGLSAKITATRKETAESDAYWTLEARQASRPVPLPNGDAEYNPGKDPSDQAEAVEVPGRTPARYVDSVARRQFPEAWAETGNDGIVDESSSDFDASGTANIFTRYLGNFYSTMNKYAPYKAVGKLYITGRSYCTASVISKYNVIVTAAHCVYDTVGNKWYGGFTFVPADRAGVAPYGKFSYSAAAIPQAYISAANAFAGRRYDVAVLKLSNNTAGKPVTYYTGNLGRSANASYVVNVHTFGYPNNLNTGKYTYICTAETFKQSTDIVGMGCDYMNGANGGPWMRSFQPMKNTALVYSVVSGRISTSTKTFYGARFSNDNIIPICKDIGC